MQQREMSIYLKIGDEKVCKIHKIAVRKNNEFILYTYEDNPNFNHLIFKALVNFGSLIEWLNHKKEGKSIILTLARFNEFENGKWVGFWTVKL